MIKYFSRYKTYPKIFNEEVNTKTDAIVVIPCYDDDFIFNTLNSLNNAITENYIIEVIVIVNSGENTNSRIKQNNRDIFKKLKGLEQNYQYRLLSANFENLPSKTAGVGLARKIGMDEAVRRYAEINNPYGIIISLDADCLVDKSYFLHIISKFGNDKHSGAATFNFEHNFDTQIFSTEEIEACKLYEAYLRYFRLALKSTGFPHTFYTIGSCFAVKALSYTKVGGMPQQQGGEDFYFLHKIAKMTNILEIDIPIVFPAPRVSDRVPFGTGPAVKKIISQKEYKLYNRNLFLLLKTFYQQIDDIYISNTSATQQIPVEILNFIGKNKFETIINECKENSKTLETFKKRFISKFDAFWIIKFLNSFNNSEDYPLYIKKQEQIT